MGHDNNAERSCERKRIYVTKKDAERALWLARKDFGDALLVIYRCHFCGAYHLGHWGGQQRLAKKAEKRKRRKTG